VASGGPRRSFASRAEPRSGGGCRCKARGSAALLGGSVEDGRLAIDLSCGELVRVCGQGVLSRRGSRRALHHGPATVSDRGEAVTPDRRDPRPLAWSGPRDGPCGTSALGRVPPRPPLPLSGSGCRTRSHLDPDRDPRPERAHLGRLSPPGKGTARDAPSAERWPLPTGTGATPVFRNRKAANGRRRAVRSGPVPVAAGACGLDPAHKCASSPQMPGGRQAGRGRRHAKRAAQLAPRR
jgi:hypothetical protein